MLNQNLRFGSPLQLGSALVCLTCLLALGCDSLPGREKKHPPKVNDMQPATGDGDTGDGDVQPGDGDTGDGDTGDGDTGDGDAQDDAGPTGDGDGDTGGDASTSPQGDDAGGGGDGDGDGDNPEPNSIFVRAAEFRTGEGAYSDTTPTDEGMKGKPGEAVDIVDAGDPTEAGATALGYTKPGEFVTYDFFIDVTAAYTLGVLVANASEGGEVGIDIDGKAVTSFTIPNTTSWTVWQTITKDLGTLEKGAHVMKVTMKTAGAGGDTGNIRSFTFQPK